ncbi:hypothetical protein Tco_0726628 [Tanacetum coccineum]|uniref:Tf2-1-like SH3-like domain-containing protein n=1 Tax=Tanacetum coccineum TaxID=301880 RepID=A0ABQ4YIH1_9ASTR
MGVLHYRLRLPEELAGMHDTFHVSNLKKCLAKDGLHVPIDEIKIDKTLRFVEEPVEIMDREVKSLKRSRIPIVKIKLVESRDRILIKRGCCDNRGLSSIPLSLLSKESSPKGFRGREGDTLHGLVINWSGFCGILHGLVINWSGFVVFNVRLMMLREVGRETLGLAYGALLICSFDLDLCSVG